MPSTTRGYPFPDGSARVGDFDQHVKDLAEAVDAKLKAVQSGTESVTIPAGSSSGSKTFNFPEPFATVPNVALSIGTTGVNYSVVRGAKSTNSLTVTAHRPPGGSTSSAATLSVEWVAQG